MNQKINQIFLFLLAAVNAVQGGSIWARKDANAKNIYADDVARKIGDVLTIVINETSNMTNTSEREMSRTTSRNNQFDGKIGVEHILTSIPAVNFGSGTTYTNTFESEADSKNKRAFFDNITVVVVDIMPNGNLVVNGTCKRNISDDIQEIEVSGIVRPSDISYSNTVDSKRVANFNIIAKYKGVAAPYNKPGWLARILDVLWPF
ncbi:MAG TPA: flagellar basal body L-ring protein FlgH [Anaerohalosphaeraceae bacterium]|nr:flagellar basal body L-ring protein FlgH [Phycisphaerae bacterium]HOK95024.1 flagellar basal body L-ring protein FlgH [Anaerohalosphaeraceae bacterium]HOL30778.1 flagellar basal body L-ring protein FlgH [Anaerohalosphaeraceae bacterium]HOM75407.1 flagellar basal body L-ring protein FlgH [Anaerohalosphaeraceae bacterium]HPC63033.1 flagellar basal body L-ring protein FlgH [Anaerohalosphaeraceae bacterium]